MASNKEKGVSHARNGVLRKHLRGENAWIYGRKVEKKFQGKKRTKKTEGKGGMTKQGLTGGGHRHGVLQGPIW